MSTQLVKRAAFIVRSTCKRSSGGFSGSVPSLWGNGNCTATRVWCLRARPTMSTLRDCGGCVRQYREQRWRPERGHSE